MVTFPQIGNNGAVEGRDAKDISKWTANQTKQPKKEITLKSLVTTYDGKKVYFDLGAYLPSRLSPVVR